jgi:hypothetical protein
MSRIGRLFRIARVCWKHRLDTFLELDRLQGPLSLTLPSRWLPPPTAPRAERLRKALEDLGRSPPGADRRVVSASLRSRSLPSSSNDALFPLCETLLLYFGAPACFPLAPGAERDASWGATLLTHRGAVWELKRVAALSALRGHARGRIGWEPRAWALLRVWTAGFVPQLVEEGMCRRLPGCLRALGCVVVIWVLQVLRSPGSIDLSRVLGGSGTGVSDSSYRSSRALDKGRGALERGGIGLVAEDSWFCVLIRARRRAAQPVRLRHRYTLKIETYGCRNSK